MRLFPVLPILSLLFGAHASSFDSRQPAAHPLDARDLLDVCALVSVNLPPVVDIDTCLCLSVLPDFMKNDPVVALAVAILGGPSVTGLLTNLIETNAANSNCNYPDNSMPACIDGNPCGFTCTNGFSANTPSNPTMCVCDAPNVVCNGQCGSPGACPSSVATAQKKRWVGSGSCTEMGHGWAACGVFGGAARAWECVNTARDLESCGGCVVPLTPYSPIGQDCTAIPGVADVACLSGKCSVRRCMSGSVPSHDGTRCTSTYEHDPQPHVARPDEEGKFVQAMRYGLEHHHRRRN